MNAGFVLLPALLPWWRWISLHDLRHLPLAAASSRSNQHSILNLIRRMNDDLFVFG